MIIPICICDDQDSHHHECPRATVEDMESVASIAERVFPDTVQEIRTQHIDSDRYRGGKSNWDRECQESRRLNRR